TTWTGGWWWEGDGGGAETAALMAARWSEERGVRLPTGRVERAQAAASTVAIVALSDAEEALRN
ncbi:hypothetical protein B1218_34675, partial [Pseudomonas ogarae]